jgi:hypothetical protein
MNEMRELTDAELAIVTGAGVAQILLTAGQIAVAGAIVGGIPGFLLGGGIGLIYGIAND